MKGIFFCAIVCLGLLTGGAMFFRIVLVCILLHEAAHVVAYVICTGKLPKLVVSAGGVKMERTLFLSVKKRLIVLIAGPLINLVLFTVFYIMARQNATYDAYFFAAANLLLAIFNMLPLGNLDGAQIIQYFMPCNVYVGWCKLQMVLLPLLVLLLPIVAIYNGFSLITCITCTVAPLYLFFNNTLL